jgi:hypothetical protein
MKSRVLLVVLGGLLLFGAGCGGGGGNASTLYTITVGLSYTVSDEDYGDETTMTIGSIEVRSDKSLKVKCSWKAKTSNNRTVSKYSDRGNVNIYITDANGKSYKHTGGEGAAYTQTELGASPVYGGYYFEPLDNTETSITFYDGDNHQSLGPISLKVANNQ